MIDSASGSSAVRRSQKGPASARKVRRLRQRHGPTPGSCTHLLLFYTTPDSLLQRALRRARLPRRTGVAPIEPASVPSPFDLWQSPRFELNRRRRARSTAIVALTRPLVVGVQTCPGVCRSGRARSRVSQRFGEFARRGRVAVVAGVGDERRRRSRLEGAHRRKRRGPRLGERRHRRWLLLRSRRRLNALRRPTRDRSRLGLRHAGRRFFRRVGEPLLPNAKLHRRRRGVLLRRRRSRSPGARRFEKPKVRQSRGEPRFLRRPR